MCCAADRSVQETLAMTPLEELEEKQAEVDFGTAMCALTILRYLTDYLPTLPMGLLSRLVSTNDSIMALLPLVDKPPWVRTRKGKVILGGDGCRLMGLAAWQGVGCSSIRSEGCHMPTLHILRPGYVGGHEPQQPQHWQHTVMAKKALSCRADRYCLCLCRLSSVLQTGMF